MATAIAVSGNNNVVGCGCEGSESVTPTDPTDPTQPTDPPPQDDNQDGLTLDVNCNTSEADTLDLSWTYTGDDTPSSFAAEATDADGSTYSITFTSSETSGSLDVTGATYPVSVQFDALDDTGTSIASETVNNIDCSEDEPDDPPSDEFTIEASCNEDGTELTISYRNAPEGTVMLDTEVIQEGSPLSRVEIEQPITDLTRGSYTVDISTLTQPVEIQVYPNDSSNFPIGVKIINNFSCSEPDPFAITAQCNEDGTQLTVNFTNAPAASSIIDSIVVDGAGNEVQDPIPVSPPSGSYTVDISTLTQPLTITANVTDSNGNELATDELTGFSCGAEPPPPDPSLCQDPDVEKTTVDVSDLELDFGDSVPANGTTQVTGTGSIDLTGKLEGKTLIQCCDIHVMQHRHDSLLDDNPLTGCNGTIGTETLVSTIDSQSVQGSVLTLTWTATLVSNMNQQTDRCSRLMSVTVAVQ